MRQSLADLYDVLEEQKTVLANMLELALQERQILINSESDKLENVIRLELKELSKLGAIEKKRAELSKKIAAELSLDPSDLSITKITEALHPNECVEILEIQKELIKLLDEHTTVNKENRQLIEAHVEYSQMMMEMMVGVEDPLNNMYSGDGRSAESKKRATGLYDGHA